MGASLGFMLPVSTPCNAIVYGSGYIPLSRMMRYGVILDVAGTSSSSRWYGAARARAALNDRVTARRTRRTRAASSAVERRRDRDVALLQRGEQVGSVGGAAGRQVEDLLAASGLPCHDLGDLAVRSSDHSRLRQSAPSGTTRRAARVWKDSLGSTSGSSR
jgi:hypothetical protein